MINKPEYSDLYKFLTSVGIILILSSVLIPWFYMSQDQGALISDLEFKNLQNQSRQLLSKRIELNLITVKFIPWISIALFLTGLFLTLYGLKKWKTKQAGLDETDELKLVQLRVETSPLNEKEIQNKVRSEINEESNLGTEEKSEFLDIPYEQSKTQEDFMDDFNMYQNLVYIEQQFYHRILEHNPFQFKVDQNVKIGNKFEIDIILTAFNPKKDKDIMLDIKYQQKVLSMHLVRQAYEKFRATYSYYVSNAKRESKMKMIIVYKSEITSAEQISRFKLAVNEYEKEINYKPFSIFVVSDENIKTFDMKNIFP